MFLVSKIKLFSMIKRRNILSIFPKKIEKYIYNFLSRNVHKKWLAAGAPLPPSHFSKQEVLRMYGKRFGITTFVETGTYLGDMIFALQDDFESLSSIEIADNLYNDAMKRFKENSSVHIIHGDSGEKLAEVVHSLNVPSLFWLDGHYSGGGTGKGAKETPIYKELEAIFSSDLKHVIVIDDARLFVGTHDYPKLTELESFVVGRRPNYIFSVENDSVRIIPKK
jgi:hypothetical protein